MFIMSRHSPLIDYYTTQGVLKTVDGTRELNEVFQEIVDILGGIRMSVTIKTQHEIELMREAGHLLEKVHDGLIPYIKPGVSTKEIDKIGEEMIRSMGCIPNF